MQVAAATKGCHHIASLLCLGDSPVHILLHLWIGGKIALDKLLRLTAWDVQTLAQAECRDAVYNTEIGGLCLATLVGGDLLNTLVIELGSRCRVDVSTLLKGINLLLVTA